MKDQYTSYGESSDEPAVETPRPLGAHLRGEFLMSWLRRRDNDETSSREETKKSEDDEDENSETGTSSFGRFRSKFSRLFSSIVQKKEPETAVLQPAATYRTVEFSPITPTEAEEISSSSERPAPGEGELRIEHGGSVPEPDLAGTTAPEAAIDSSANTDPGLVTVEDTAPSRRDGAYKQPDVDILQAEPIPADDTQPEQRASAISERARPDSSSAHHDSASLGPAIRPERPVIIEKKHGGAAIAFVAADVLSRYRDRKIRRKLRETNKRLAAVETKKPSLSTTEVSVPLSRPEQTTPKVQKEALIRTAIKQSELKMQSAEAKTSKKGQQEKPTARANRNLSAAEFQPDKSRAARVEKAPPAEQRSKNKEYGSVQDIGKRAKESIELKAHTIEIDENTKEISFDRRHEILDDPVAAKKLPQTSTVTTDNSPEPIASIIAKKQMQTAGKVQETLTEPIKSPNQAGYKGSMQAGFFAALIIIGAAAVFYLSR